MTRVGRIARIVGASIGLFLLVLAVAGIVIVQTQWFRNLVRDKIIAAMEEATGGSAHIGAFTFNWRHLRAQIRDFTIHGLEPTGVPPLFHANLVQVDLKLLSPFHGFVDIAYLLVDTPQARVIVYSDGHTNIPAPKVQAKSNGKTGLETIVDLAIGQFDLRNGSFLFGDQKAELNASGANLRAQLAYNALNPAYSGEIDISPLHLGANQNAPLDVDIKLPLTAHKDAIQVVNAQFTTPRSHVVVSGEIDHLIAPRTSAHVNAEISLDEVRRAAGLTMPLDLAQGPRILMADVTASMDAKSIRLQSARVTMGRTNIEASGNLKGANGGGATFNAALDLGELDRLLRLKARPEGTVKLGGTARLDAQNNYRIAGNLEARGVAFQEGARRISNVSLDSSMAVDPRRIALSNLRLDVLGGRFTGAASLEEMTAFQVSGRLENFDLESLSRMLLDRRLGYNGVVSGPVQASGNVNHFSDVAGRVNLAIAPAGRSTDIPVSGRLNIDYNGRGDTVTVGSSYIALPHTRIDLAGQLGRQIEVKLVSHSFADFQPLGEIPISLGTGGEATLNATVNGKLSAPNIAGIAAILNFSVQGRPFTRFSARVAASPSSVAVNNAVVARVNLQMQVSASARLRDWKILPSSPVRADATVRNADVKDVLALADEASIPMTGAFTLDAHINGTMGSPAGTVDASASNGSIAGEKYDSFALQARMAEGAITVPRLTLTAGAARLEANGAFQHPVNDLEQGTIAAHVSANQVQLAQFQSLVRERPGLQGTVTLTGDGSGALRSGQFAISSLTANLAARGLAMQGKTLGDLTATANTERAALRYNVSSNFAGSSVRIDGESDLNGDHRTSANAVIANLPLDRALAAAGESDLPLKGTFGATAQVSGTLRDPQANANFTVVKGSAYQQPFTRLEAAVNYSGRNLDVPRFHVEDGASFVDASLVFAHPAHDLQDGEVRVHVNSNPIQLAGLNAIRQSQPGLGGVVQLTADAAASLRKNAAPRFSTLNANLRATGVSVNKQNLGDLTASATTRGNTVDFSLTSDLAHSNIKGSGSVELTGAYPMNARVSFANVTYRGLKPLLSDTPPQPFDASLEGSVTVSGPASDPAALSGTLELTKLEAHSAAPAILGAQPRVQLDLHNSGNIVAALNRGTVTIQSFRLAGAGANLTVSGTAGLTGQRALGLRVDGNVNLEMLEAFNTEIYSSGSITLNAAIAGTAPSPDLTGQLQLQKVSFNMLELPNGLSNATGSVAFTGSEAYIQNITGESGGGKVTLGGTVVYGGPRMQFNVRATANGVHVQYPSTITTQLNANLTLNGTNASSLVTGRVSIVDVALHSGTDIGNVLTAAASPPSTSTGTGGPLAGMRFDVRVVTAPDVQFRTTLTQNLQADANLTLLGTPDNPGMLGRVTVTEGDVVFFGSKYTIDEGSITFSDASQINPVLNIDLETTVEGIDVTLSVSGPMDKMKLSYRSDPPLQFQQIVSLLASGTTPTTDPVLAARAPVAPQQTLEQSGASALLGQAVANPVSGRLQRLFGVSRLSIDPQIVGATNTAQATLTLQQQITPSITFTYIEDVTQSNPEVIRAEWEINRLYSAVAQRDVNGEVTVDLFYKRRFH